MDKLVEGLQAHPNVVVLSDEIYSHMLYGGREHVSLLQYDHMRDRTIMLDGWSKTYAMTGWRLGFAVWPKSIADTATRLAINCHSCVNAPNSIRRDRRPRRPARSGHDHGSGIRRATEGHCPRAKSDPGFSCVDPGGAFYAFPNITGTGMSARELQDKLLTEAGVATVAGTSFGDFGEGYIRFSYANSVENIEKAIDKIKELLQG